ncbi:Maternal effect embryoarrest [Heracleum sosnowskyi]|uniref:Maternal effect embryoarrest n=1 Tax=Heracleum sosnowskyi TaxID=360622 RepID=A0AAD8I0T1_9APIA|nr:Maternal effect embryoarrest [Heracleum sosnowskyi]
MNRSGSAGPVNVEVIDEHKKAEKERREAHIKTLDDLVNVNSLFTLAVFVGLSQASPGAISLENKEECNAGPGVAKMLVLYEVVAFACFLLSSLVAKVIKLLLGLDSEKSKIVHDRFDLKDFLLILTASASVGGIVLLTLSVVNIVQVRIGVYSCGSAEARRAIWALCTIVAIALVIYVLALCIAIYASITTDGLHSSSSNGNSNRESGAEKDDGSASTKDPSAV